MTRNRYVPVPRALTVPLQAPALPPRRCHQIDGTPAVCVLDALNWIIAWRGLWRRANVDRAITAKLSGAPVPAHAATSREPQ